MGRAYFIAAGVGLVLCIVFPPLLPFVLIGIAAGLLPRLFQDPKAERHPAYSRSRQERLHSLRAWIAWTGAIVAGGALFGLGAAILSVLDRGASDNPGYPRVMIEVPVQYEGRGTYEDSPEQLLLADRLTVSLDALRTAAEDYRLLREEDLRLYPDSSPLSSWSKTPSAGKLQRILNTKLKAAGWTMVRRSTEGSTFAKLREVPLRSRIFPIDTGNEIPLPHFREDASGLEVPLDVQLGDDSEMVLVAPTWTFNSTRPASSREELLTRDLEERRMPVGPSTLVEVEVRSPWFRSGIARSLLDWILSGGKYVLGVLLGLLIAVLSEPVKEWIRRRLKIPKTTG